MGERISSAPAENDLFTLPVKPPRKIRPGVEFTGIIYLKQDFVKGGSLSSGERILFSANRRKTEGMQKAEAKIGEPLEVFLIREYWINGRSTTDLGGALQVPHITVAHWAVKLGIPTRSLKEAASLFWKDPQKRTNRLLTMHSPEARNKRGQASKRRWEERTDVRMAVIEGQKQRHVKFMTAVLGDNPLQTLRRMYMDERLTDLEISQRLKLSSYTVYRWRKLFGIQGRRKWLTPHVKASNKDIVDQGRQRDLTHILSQRELDILNRRYPQEGKPVGLEKLADEQGVKRQRIHQVEIQALKKLSKALSEANT